MKLHETPFSTASPPKDVPYTPDGSFNWLRSTATHDEWAIGDRAGSNLPSQLEALTASAEANGLTLPAIFTSFMADPTLHKHLRSANGDYLRLAESVLPFANGYLIRFLSDQQECAHWYLFVNSTGSDHCVVSSYEYFDADEMDYELDELKETDFQFWTESFELFFCRYWIEHEIMFAQVDETPFPDIDPQILALYTNGG
tara:strand:- start:9946 stop:10545 length:600 start_codon:yes stop_codon:yes gene_type:complete